MKRPLPPGFHLLCTILGFLTCAALALNLRAQQSQQAPQSQTKQQGVIRVQTNLVSILASVIDANGEPIPDLKQDVFQLSEEGVAQKIERFEPQTNRPLDLALMVDSSMSTYKDMKFETESAAHFIGQVVRSGDTLSVFEFDERVTQLSDFSSDVPRLQTAARRITPGAGTSMYDAIVLGSNTLRRRPLDRRRAIVLVTDAGETTSLSKFEDARRAAIASEALLYSIVIRAANESGRNTAGEHALITITDSTGGAMFMVDETHSLDAVFERIDRELRTQYLLGYYPTPVPPPGSRRHVTVKVSAGGIVRYRREYFTAYAPR
jgi:Ca-activated chloride channel homolog